MKNIMTINDPRTGLWDTQLDCNLVLIPLSRFLIKADLVHGLGFDYLRTGKQGENREYLRKIYSFEPRIAVFGIRGSKFLWNITLSSSEENL
jgi:hypothetical protein